MARTASTIEVASEAAKAGWSLVEREVWATEINIDRSIAVVILNSSKNYSEAKQASFTNQSTTRP